MNTRKRDKSEAIFDKQSHGEILIQYQRIRHEHFPDQTQCSKVR